MNVLEIAAGVFLGQASVAVVSAFGMTIYKRRLQAKKIAQLDAYYQALLDQEQATDSADAT